MKICHNLISDIDGLILSDIILHIFSTWPTDKFGTEYEHSMTLEVEFCLAELNKWEFLFRSGS